MATVIPARLPSHASRGEERVYGLLAGLPEDCFVYYEPEVDGRHPDFVVILPDLGVLVIEVKGWYAKNLRHLEENMVTHEWGGRLVREIPPEKQVRDYLFSLMRIASEHRYGERLLNRDGRHQGRFRFPFAPLVVLSNISDGSLEPHRIDRSKWERLFPSKRTLRKEQLAALKELRGQALVEALRPYIHPSWSFAPLGEEEVKALRVVVHPEIELGDGLSLRKLECEPGAINDQQDVLQVLDVNQEEHAQALGEGHRIIYGVAGSGKTVLLLARAKRLAQTGRKRILVTCYNRMLANWMREELRVHPNITVTNFHAWASSVGLRWQKNESDDTLGERLLAHLQDRKASSPRYEAVLVDEAQDFEPSWFRRLLAAMEDPENGDLLIVADGSQGLYRRSRVSWSQLGIKARGRTISCSYQLDRNYRNSREIIALAETFACSTSDLDNLDGIQSMRVSMTRCERSGGASPVFAPCIDGRGELRRAYHFIEGLLNGQWCGRPVGKFRPHEIALLYPSAETAGERSLLEEFAAWMNRRGIQTTWLSRDRPSRDLAGNDQIKIQTIHSAKGLQYRAVILLWADKLPKPKANSEQRLAARRLLYVGMTRAISLLAITASARSAFVDEIASAPAVDAETCQVDQVIPVEYVSS